MIRNEKDADEAKFEEEAQRDPDQELMIYIGTTRRSFKTSHQRQMHWALMWPAWGPGERVPEEATDVVPETHVLWRVLEAQNVDQLRKLGISLHVEPGRRPEAEAFVYRYSLKRRLMHHSLQDIELQELAPMSLKGRQDLITFAIGWDPLFVGNCITFVAEAIWEAYADKSLDKKALGNTKERKIADLTDVLAKSDDGHKQPTFLKFLEDTHEESHALFLTGTDWLRTREDMDGLPIPTKEAFTGEDYRSQHLRPRPIE